MVRVYTFRRFAFRLVGRAKELLVLCSGKNVLHHGFYACRNGPVLGFLVGSGSRFTAPDCTFNTYGFRV